MLNNITVFPNSQFISQIARLLQTPLNQSKAVGKFNATGIVEDSP